MTDASDIQVPLPPSLTDKEPQVIEEKEPAIRIPSDPTIPTNHRGTLKLKALNHDPMDHLVSLARRLEKELWIQEQIRDGKYLVLNAKEEMVPLRYSGVTHAAMLQQYEKVNNDLLRYKYARVPESVDVNIHKPEPLKIILSDTVDLPPEVDEHTHEGVYTIEAPESPREQNFRAPDKEQLARNEFADLHNRVPTDEELKEFMNGD